MASASVRAWPERGPGALEVRPRGQRMRRERRQRVTRRGSELDQHPDRRGDLALVAAEQTNQGRDSDGAHATHRADRRGELVPSRVAAESINVVARLRFESGPDLAGVVGVKLP